MLPDGAVVSDELETSQSEVAFQVIRLPTPRVVLQTSRPSLSNQNFDLSPGAPWLGPETKISSRSFISLDQAVHVDVPFSN
jgi:hypothetical protein